MESDAFPPSPDNFVSFRVPSVMKKYEHHVHEKKETEDVIENPELGGQVLDFITAYKLKRNIRKPSRFSDMVVDYALSVEVMEDCVPSTFREEKLSSESEL